MNAKRPIWVIFDVGGVLYHFAKAIDETEKHLDLPKDRFLHIFIKNLEEVEVSKKDYKEVVEEKLSLLKMSHKINEVIPILFDLKKFLVDTLLLVRQLHDTGYSLALMTNTWHGITDEVTAKLEEFTLFNQVFDSTKLGLRKPERTIFLHVEKTLDVTKDKIFLIDDNIKNIEAAKQLDWQTFHYDLGIDEGRTSNKALRKKLLS